MESRLSQNLLSTLLLLLLSFHFFSPWPSAASPCNWTGVTCNVTRAGRRVITEIHLSNTSLVGTLDMLSTSPLYHHSPISSSASTMERSRAPTIETLVKLSSLDLTSNQLLTGKIPFEIGSMGRLQFLNLSGNQISGSIPPSLANLSMLNYLLLDSNSLSGTIPEELGRLRNLVFLKLADNLLTGFIPPSLGNLTRLYKLAIYDNK